MEFLLIPNSSTENLQLFRLHHILLTVLSNLRECAESPEFPLIAPQQSRRGFFFKVEPIPRADWVGRLPVNPRQEPPARVLSLWEF